MVVFLFAGHEVNSSRPSCGAVVKSSLQTTAHTLCFTFALLALHPDEQERLYQHIKGVMSSLNGMPVGSRNPNLYRAHIPIGLRRHEPLHSIISVSSPNFAARMKNLSPR
jgi:cytochrome P450